MRPSVAAYHRQSGQPRVLALFARGDFDHYRACGPRRLLLDPIDAQPLIKALSGRWHYSEDRVGNVIKDLPEKSHPWSDLGDSFCYLLCGLMPEMAEQLRPAKKVTVITAYNPFR
jgi:hypothetical protein